MQSESGSQDVNQPGLSGLTGAGLRSDGIGWELLLGPSGL